jgi:hypothetical protein
MSIGPNERPISRRLQSMLQQADRAYGNGKKKVMAAYKQALSEGFTPYEAKELVLSKVKSLSRRTVYSYLPDSAKNKKMQQLRRKKSPLQICNDTVEKGAPPNKEVNEVTERKTEVCDGEEVRPGKVILNSTLADVIHDNVHSDRANRFPYIFVLTHDGRNVRSVEDYESEDVLTSSTSMISMNRDESDSKSKDMLLYPGHSDFKRENNEINSPIIESPNCKLHIQKIQELEGTNRELEEALKKSSAFTTADIGLATRGQGKKEFEIPIDINKILEILRYIQSLKTEDFPPQILIIAYLDTETGEVLSVSVEKPHTEEETKKESA